MCAYPTSGAWLGYGMAQESHSYPSMLECIQPDESAWDLICRLKNEKLTTGLHYLDSHLTMRPGNITEVAGPTGSGKTQLLLSVAAHCLVRGLVSGADPAGAAVAQSVRHSVLWVDMDGKLDAVLITQTITACLARAFPELHFKNQHARALLAQYVPDVHAGRLPPAPQLGQPMPDLAAAQQTVHQWDGMLKDCLARMHVLRPHDSLELLSGLLACGQRLRQWKAEGTPCCLLILDNVGAFTYLDKAHRAQVYVPLPPPVTGAAGQQAAPGSPRHSGSRPASPAPHDCPLTPAIAAMQGLPPVPPNSSGTAPPPPLSTARVQAAMAALLKALSLQHRLCVLTSKHASVAMLEADVQGPMRLQAKEYMSSSWTHQVMHRLLLGASRVVQGRQPGTVATEVPVQLWQGAQCCPMSYVYVDTTGVT